MKNEKKTRDTNLIDGKYLFKDLVNLVQLEKIFMLFSKTTGYTVGLVSYPEQELLIGTGWREVCTKFHRLFLDTEKFCRQSNLALTLGLNKHGEINTEFCKNGMIDGATPILIKGVHVANLFTGQVLFEKPDIACFRKQGEKHGYDVDAYIKALSDVPVVEKEMLMNTLVFLAEMAVVLAEEGIANLRSDEAIQIAKKSEARYRTLFDSIPVGIYLTTVDGRFLDGNPALMEMLGYPNHETMLSSDVRDLFLDSKDRDNKLNMIESDGSITNKIMQLRRYDGEIIWAQDSANIVRDDSGKTLYYYGRMEDITERIKTEKALKENEEKYRSLIEQSNDAIYLLYEDHFEMINDQFTKIFGVTSAEACASEFDFMTLVAPQSREMLRERTRKVDQGEELLSRYEFTAYDRDGKEIELGVSVSYISYKEGIATQGILRDITKSKKAEKALKGANKRLHAQLDANKKLEAALREQAIRDSLTGLFNRYYLEEALEQELAKAVRKESSLSIVILDLDNLKEINDTHGHIIGGDRALQTLANSLVEMCRAEDTICRYGGDEFLVVLYDTPVEAAYERAVEWKETIAKTKIITEKNTFRISFSAGIASFPQDGLTGEEILVHADDALYRAKEFGRNQVVVYQEEKTT